MCVGCVCVKQCGNTYTLAHREPDDSLNPTLCTLIDAEQAATQSVALLQPAVTHARIV